MTCHVDILLGTYNGQSHLHALLASIATQSHEDWTLHVRDDGSTDRTLAIVTEFAREHPERVILHASDSGNLGPAGNFGALLSAAQGPYITFCDQDDVWLPERISLLAGRMGELEDDLGLETPLLVHSDMTVVDDHLNVLGDSFWRYQNMDPKLCGLPRLLTQNVVTGCALMLNRAMADRAGAIPPEAVMHDWWIALVASLFGHIEAIDTPTLLYRQHASNDTGAKRWSNEYIRQQAVEVFGPARRKKLQRTADQAAVILDRYREDLSEADQRTLSAYANLLNASPLARPWIVLKYGFLKQGLRRNIGHWLSL